MDCQTAAKYCGFGRTRFRQLVASGVFPPPVTIEGRKRWLAKDLDVSLVRLRNERRARK
jgi:predicted DNA-binding transcriptional regulator AlpA